jgi:hypothetical protein
MLKFLISCANPEVKGVVQITAVREDAGLQIDVTFRRHDHD